jgi:hypothetical protein
MRHWMTPRLRSSGAPLCRGFDVDLACEAARILDIPAPGRVRLQRWLAETFTDWVARRLWAAACDLGERNMLEDARAVVEDACRAQRRNAPTGESAVATLQLDLSEFGACAPRFEIVDRSVDDVVVAETLSESREVDAAQ